MNGNRVNDGDDAGFVVVGTVAEETELLHRITVSEVTCQVALWGEVGVKERRGKGRPSLCVARSRREAGRRVPHHKMRMRDGVREKRSERRKGRQRQVQAGGQACIERERDADTETVDQQPDTSGHDVREAVLRK